MKRGAVFLVLFWGVFVTLGVVSGQISCSNDDEIILKISDGTNAHGEIASQSNYDTEVCSSVALTPDPLCSNGPVVRLSGDVNAHAEGPGENTAGYRDVCFNELSGCSLKGSCDIVGGETEIVRLSDTTNAHLELAGGTNYANLICCTVGGGPLPPPPGEIYWADMEGNEIVADSSVYIGNTIKLVVTGLTPDADVTFEIFETFGALCLGSDNIRTVSGGNALVFTSDGGGTAEAEWEITQGDYDAGTNCEGDEQLELFFTAGDGSTTLGPSLQILLQPEVRNSPPVAVISAPVHRQVYYVGTSLQFSDGSFDVDGTVVGYEWTILEDSFTSNQESFTHNFVTGGLRTITLKVTDNQGESSEDQIAIVVLESPGMMAFINGPRHHEIYRDPARLVDYLADDSYVVNSIPGVGCPTVKCLGGNCPSMTGNSPNSCDFDGDLIFNDPLVIGGAPADFSEMDFQWTFRSNFGASFGLTVGGLDEESGTVEYDRYSSQFNDKLVSLGLSYDDGAGIVLNEQVGRVFTLLEGDDNTNACVGDELWVFENGVLIDRRDVDTHTGDPANNIAPACAGPNGVIDEGGDDCPCSGYGFRCTVNGCAQPVEPLHGCGSYTSQGEAACDNYDQEVLEEDDLWDEKDCDPEDPDNSGSGGYIDCSCDWGDLGGGEVCFLRNTFVPRDDGDPGTPLCGYSCFNSYPQTECNAGYLNINVETEFNPDIIGDAFCNTFYGFDTPETTDGPEGECLADTGSHTLPCGRPQIELPFFGFTQMVISGLFIFVLYLLIIVYRRMEGKDL